MKPNACERSPVPGHAAGVKEGATSVGRVAVPPTSVVLKGTDDGASAAQSCGEKVNMTTEPINRTEEEEKEEESYIKSFHGSVVVVAIF